MTKETSSSISSGGGTLSRNARWLLGFNVSLFFLTAFSCFYQEAAANNDEILLFELNRTSMMQPVYNIKVYRDGKVHYRGEMVRSVGVVGDRYTQMSQSQLDEFTLYFLSLPFEVPKRYEMTRGNETWVETIDYKDIYASMHINDPIFYALLTKKLDKLINLRKWICFQKDSHEYPENHPEYKSCLLRDDVPDDIESFFK